MNIICERKKLNDQKNFRESGILIDNLINKVNFNNNLLNNNILLFSEYLNINNNFHNKYLTRFH